MTKNEDEEKMFRERSLRSGLIRSLAFIALACFGFHVSSEQSVAEPISFSFSGTVFRIHNSLDPLPLPFQVGDRFSGRYSFESTTADVRSDPFSGFYRGAIISARIRVGSYVATADRSGDIYVQDNKLPHRDQYIVDDVDPIGPDLFGVPVSEFSLQLTDRSGIAITDDTLFLTPPRVRDFLGEESYARLWFFEPFSYGPTVAVDSSIESLTLIPEPDSLKLAFVMLTASGVITLSSRARVSHAIRKFSSQPRCNRIVYGKSRGVRSICDTRGDRRQLRLD